MDDEKKPAKFDQSSCVAGLAVGVAIGVIGCALVTYLTIRRQPPALDGRTMRALSDWIERGNG